MLIDLIPVALTVEEGNNLIGISSNFACPDSLGEGQKFSNSERVLANMEVAVLYWGLREVSPLVKDKRKLLWFGPVEAYEDMTDKETGRRGKRLIDPFMEVEVTLDDKQMRGLIWCLLVRLHPMSSAISGAGDQISIVWPIARKVGYEDYLREQLGLDKATPKAIKKDKPKKDSNGNGGSAPAPVAAAPDATKV